MKTPKVTFIVPCYNLAHLLSECINSILSQTFEDFEILIMDDCSPDNTPEVARSFADPRVIHVRNETNLRHLANYNKGIGMARGEYIWLISADDLLRGNNVLQRYVDVLDNQPHVGFTFCPAMAVIDHEEREIVPWSYHGDKDAIFKGLDFLDKLLKYNCVAAPSVLARKECYQVEVFPPDLPNTGDWYLWCIFSLYYDVAYFCEPLVGYRFHKGQMTNDFLTDKKELWVQNDFDVFWKLKQHTNAKGLNTIVLKCESSLVDRYASAIYGKESMNASRPGCLDQLEHGILAQLSSIEDANNVYNRVCEALGDRHYWSRNYKTSFRFYEVALKNANYSLRLIFKYLLLRLGPLGVFVRNAIISMKRVAMKLSHNTKT